MIDLTILGASGACPAAGGACSSYLVQSGATSIVLDCGPGSLPNLRGVIDYRAVTAVVLSHLHADHILDLVPYHDGLRYGPGADASPRIPLWSSPGGRATLQALGVALGHDADHFDQTFAIEEYDPAAPLTIGDLRLTFTPTQHYIPCWGIRCEAGGATLVYSADTGPTPAVVELARDADLFLCEATLLDREAPEDRPGHLTAAEAGALARQAGARRLLLTHLWPELGLEALLARGQAAFGGPTALAREGDRHRIAPGGG
jgi:ribonuclease BN (tRNA processing enzyme)